MSCHLTGTWFVLLYSNFRSLVKRRSLMVTLSMGRQGACKHKWEVYVLSHTVHLLLNWLARTYANVIHKHRVLEYKHVCQYLNLQVAGDIFVLQRGIRRMPRCNTNMSTATTI